MNRNSPPPIASTDDLAQASLERVQDQVVFELHRIQYEEGLTQDQLREVLGFDSAGSVSKLLNGKTFLSVRAAKSLDETGRRTRLGCSFKELQRVLAEKRRRAKARLPRQVKSGKFDVFLAVPMASTADDEHYRRVRKHAQSIVRALRNEGYEVYCGALDVEDRDDFDAPNFAVEENVPALINSRYFVLWVGEAVDKPSSVWVEAGIALALGKPSTYLVGHPDYLPYILRQASEAKGLDADVTITWLTDGMTAAGLIRRNHTEWFTR